MTYTRRPRPLKRKIHIDGEVWTYAIGSGGIYIRTPDENTTHRVTMLDLYGLELVQP